MKPANPRTPGTVSAYSYSRWDSYRSCPQKFKYSNIDRLKEPQSPQMAEGDRIHKLGESYLKGQLEELPVEFEKFADQMRALREQHAAAEENWAFDRDWKQCEYFDKATYVRVKLDSHIIVMEKKLLRVIDYKTGKYKENGLEAQMELYALAGFAKYQGLIERVETELWFTNDGRSKTQSFGLWQHEVLKANWARRVEKMMNDTTFEPTPGPQCRWCFFSKANGGPCKF